MKFKETFKIDFFCVIFLRDLAGDHRDIVHNN